MTEHSALDDIERPEETDDSANPLRVALGFFIFPMLLVIGAVGVFLLFGLIAHEDKTAQEYLAEVTGGGINEPWQGAFGLANLLAQDDSLRGDPAIAQLIANALDHPNAEDPQVRTFLLLALGRVGDPDSIPLLTGYLDDPDADVRLKTLWAIGNIGAPAAQQSVPQLVERLTDEDAAVRGYSAYVLGTLDDQRAVDPLEVALNDPVGQVRFNAAVALARLGSDAGMEELHRMIDRKYLVDSGELNAQQQQDAMVAAIQALTMLRAMDVRDELNDLLENDPDARVREAARAALASIYRSSQR
ncbi:MAG: HEAT repeat domain-containing protein [Acidobacteriota bacterium]|jgi:HEAT repeat protein